MVYTIDMKKVYPDWVEKYHVKGTSIKKLKNGYGLYKCTSVYDKDRGYPKSVQVYLGMITEDKGFIMKRQERPEYLEYGLSAFIMHNYKRDLLRSSYDHNILLVKLGIIAYVFKSLDDVIFDRTYLSIDDRDRLIELNKTINIRRIKTITNKITSLLDRDLKDDKELIERLLLLVVIEKGRDIDTVYYPDGLIKLIEHRGLSL